MGLFYSDTEPRQQYNGKVDFYKLDAVKGFLKHYENYLTLSWMVANEPRAREKKALVHELGICERKLDWWKRHPNYDVGQVAVGTEQIKARWRRGNGGDPLAGLKLRFDLHPGRNT